MSQVSKSLLSIHHYSRIFEGSGEYDILRLLFGRLPSSVTGPALSGQIPGSVPLSTHYARALADLARQRGFDGYLLNVECPLGGGPEQARALTGWIGLLRYYLKTQVGDHAEVIWYDSVVYTGKLAWQDRLNNNNVVFYPPSTGFFTNYSVGVIGVFTAIRLLISNLIVATVVSRSHCRIRTQPKSAWKDDPRYIHRRRCLGTQPIRRWWFWYLSSPHTNRPKRPWSQCRSLWPGMDLGDHGGEARMDLAELVET